jgi:hypothetical protein
VKHSVIRLALAGGLALSAAAPLTQQAHAWACIDDVGRALCFVVGTTCSQVPDKDVKYFNLRDLCTFD